MTTEYMHDHTIVTLDDFPDLRFIVYQDFDAFDPVAESDAPVEMYAFAGGYPSTISDNTDNYWCDVFSRFASQWQEDKALEVVRRFARIFHNWTADRAESCLTIFHHAGYSQSDWQHLFVAVTEESYGSAESYAEEWAQWARGDVYGVCPERFVTCDSEECHASVSDHWVRVNDQGVEFDNLWGIYADDAEEAAEYFARDYL